MLGLNNVYYMVKDCFSNAVLDGMDARDFKREPAF